MARTAATAPVVIDPDCLAAAAAEPHVLVIDPEVRAGSIASIAPEGRVVPGDGDGVAPAGPVASGMAEEAVESSLIVS